MLEPPAKRIVALMGPTASGKTELVTALAQCMPIDIVSVDSAAIYRGMDIGTAKPGAQVLARYPHRLIDIREPSQNYSVGEFVRDARACVADAFARNRLPVLVGGTMLYFKAFKGGLAALPHATPSVRAALAERARREGLPALHAELQRIDPIAAAGIHPNNPQRLLRALEVHAMTGRPISAFWSQQHGGGVAHALGARLVEFAIEPPRETETIRIESRFATMLTGGFLDEVRALMARGDLTLDTSSMRAVGYRQAWQHLEGAIDHETMVARAVSATRQLAKRQRTWLRRWPDKIVLNETAEANLAAILQSLESDRIVRRSQ